jgi:hypothetical protein
MKLEIQRIHALQLGTVYAVGYILLAILVSPVIVLIDFTNGAHGQTIAYFLGYASVTIAVSFILQCLLALLYNFVVKLVGGFRIEVRDA